MTRPGPDWDPKSRECIEDQRAAYDGLRERCPVAFSEEHGWSVSRHADITRILGDPETFSNAVSAHMPVPNGMDPPDHTRYRALIDRFFTTERVATFEDGFRAIAGDAARAAVAGGAVDAMGGLATPFAAAAQCHFMGWPDAAAEALIDWTRRHHNAIRCQDRAALSALAAEFEELVSRLVSEGAEASADSETTTALLRQARIAGRPLTEGELVSILRNWSAGEIGTIAAAVGILVHYLATHPEEQRRYRAEGGMPVAVIDEVLRADGPLVASRRKVRQPVELGGRALAPGDRLSILWIAGNRDPRAFEGPDRVDADRDQGGNLIYGAGIHVCPGADLSRLELGVFVQELLRATREIALDPVGEARRATSPAAGWAELPVRLS